VLSDSLDDLEDKQLVNREIVSEKPVRVEYSLTEYGESLETLIMEMRDWDMNYLGPAKEKDSSLV